MGGGGRVRRIIRWASPVQHTKPTVLPEVQSTLTMQYSLSRQHGVLGTRWCWEGRNSAWTLCVASGGMHRHPTGNWATRPCMPGRDSVIALAVSRVPPYLTPRPSQFPHYNPPHTHTSFTHPSLTWGTLQSAPAPQLRSPDWLSPPHSHTPP